MNQKIVVLSKPNEESFKRVRKKSLVLLCMCKGVAVESS